MATAKTRSFYLTETVNLPAAAASGTRTQGTIDLGAYVNVPTGQAIAIESVDFILQHDGTGHSQELATMLQSNGCLSFLPMVPGYFTIRTCIVQTGHPSLANRNEVFIG